MCEANETFDYKDQYGQTQEQNTHIAACAQPYCMIDPNTNGGALAIAFPNGMIPDIGKIGDLFLNTNLLYPPCDWVQSPLGGDYPQNPLTYFIVQGTGKLHPPLGQIISIAFYDWLRRQRTNIDIASLITVMNQPFNTSMPSTSPQVHYYQANSSKQLDEVVLPDTPTIANPISQKQYRAISGEALHSLNNKYYDFILKDYVNIEGRTMGGGHAGEPFGGSTQTVPGGGTINPMDEHPQATRVFPTGPAGGAVRPTYMQMGTAVEMRFRERDASTPQS
jgi:hypothetical protein